MSINFAIISSVYSIIFFCNTFCILDPALLSLCLTLPFLYSIWFSAVLFVVSNTANIAPASNSAMFSPLSYFETICLVFSNLLVCVYNVEFMVLISNYLSALSSFSNSYSTTY